MVLTLQNLSKRYGSLTAVSGLSLSIDKGNIYGLLGPNGSGKTTTLGMVLGVINPTAGGYAWFGGNGGGHDRRKIGSILETPNFYHYLSALANLRIAADIKGVPYTDIGRVLDMVNLAERQHSHFSTFSLGMKQRLSIASALLGNPEVVVLDEPTNGLDPAGIVEIRELIMKIGREGRTIILASHLLDEVEKVCTHVAILQKGRLLACGSVAETLGGSNIIEAGSDNMDALEAAAKLNPDVKSVQRNSAGRLEMAVADHCSSAALNEFFHKKGITVSHLALRKKSLETRFLELTKS